MIENAAGIKNNLKNKDSHGNQESAQRLQSPAVFFQPIKAIGEKE